MNRETAKSSRPAIAPSHNRPFNVGGKEFRTFEDLEVYRVARAFRKLIYGVAQKLPSGEKFGLASQMRRAAVSLTNNIAEGHGRHHYPDQIRFMFIARGSLEELIDDLNICEDADYLPAVEVSALKQQGWRTYQLINGYIRYLREQKAGDTLTLHEESPGYGLEGVEPLPDSTIQRFNDSTI